MPFVAALDNTQEVDVTVEPLDPDGQPAQLDGPVTVEVTSGNGTVRQATVENPLTFVVVSGDTPGTTEYLVRGDARIGTGEVIIQDTGTLTVTSAEASSFGFAVGTPRPKQTV